MGKVFTSDPKLENRRYSAVTRLVHDYTPFDYDEPVNEYSDDQLTAQINQDRIYDNRNVSPRTP